MKVAIFSGFFFLAATASGQAQDLNSQLRSQVCANDWSGAIASIESMKRISSAEYQSQLNIYRQRLQTLQSANVSWNCEGTQNAIASPAPGASQNPITNSPALLPGSGSSPFNPRINQAGFQQNLDSLQRRR